jgi:hypothetical protein
MRALVAGAVLALAGLAPHQVPSTNVSYNGRDA